MQPIRTSIYGLEDYLDIEELNEKANCLAEETAIATDSLNSLMNDLENAKHNLKVIRAQTVDRNRKEKDFLCHNYFGIINICRIFANTH